MSSLRWITVLVALVAVFAWTDETHAQRVHLLAVGDTDDPAIGEGVENDLGNVVSTFFILLRERQLEFERLSGEDVSTENVLRAINNVRLAPDDALVFYWSGHGARDDNGQYLQMPKGGNLYRSTLLGALKKKGARLTVLLTDCCNAVSDASAGAPPISPASPDPNRKTSPLFDQLFLKTEGLVDVNAAEEGQLALGTKEGGLFTLSLVYMMPVHGGDDMGSAGLDDAFGVFWRNSEKRLSWQDVIEQSRQQVQDLFTEMNPDGLAARDGKVHREQTVAAWELPEPPKASSKADRGSRFGVEATNNNGEGVRVVRVWDDYPGTRVTEVGGAQWIRLQPGDVILTINGRRITGKRDYWNAVKESPLDMQFTVRDVTDGTIRRMKVQLRY